MQNKLAGKGLVPTNDADAVTTTFEEWVGYYLERIKVRKKNPRNDIDYLGRAVKEFGKKPLPDVTVVDISKMFAAITKSGKDITANRWLASVRACIQEAWRADLVPSNPAMKVKPNPEHPGRTRTFTEDELAKLVAALDLLPSVHVQAAFKVMFQTGCRLSEILKAKWNDFDLSDLERATWRIPTTKSGKPQTIPLHPALAEYLSTLPRVSSLVIPGDVDPENPRSDLKKAWTALLGALQLDKSVPPPHIHDIRRTFGLLVSKTAGLHVASRLLRHSDIRVTQLHYAPLGTDDLRGALDVVADQIAGKTGKVVKKTGRRRR